MPAEEMDIDATPKEDPQLGDDLEELRLLHKSLKAKGYYTEAEALSKDIAKKAGEAQKVAAKKITNASLKHVLDHAHRRLQEAKRAVEARTKAISDLQETLEAQRVQLQKEEQYEKQAESLVAVAAKEYQDAAAGAILSQQPPQQPVQAPFSQVDAAKLVAHVEKSIHASLPEVAALKEQFAEDQVKAKEAGMDLSYEHHIVMALTKNITKAMLDALAAQAPPQRPAFQLGIQGAAEASAAAPLQGVAPSQASTRAGDPPQLRGRERMRSKSRRRERSQSGGSRRRSRSDERRADA